MLDFIRSFLSNEGIGDLSCVSLDECIIKRKYLLDRVGISSGSVVVFTVPYLSEASNAKKNISAYAAPLDYHLFFDRLFSDLTAALKSRFPEFEFAGFSDHSPIDEIHAAARAGLGVIGKNHLLITEKYSSYVFIGALFTTAELPSHATDIAYCISCGRCAAACPVGLDARLCLSALTQKKGTLFPEEAAIIARHGSAWGCDICQQVCPYTVSAIKNKTIFSNIPFFNNDLMPYITSEKIKELSEERFAERAFSWRGRDVLLRNLSILEGIDDGSLGS